MHALVIHSYLYPYKRIYTYIDGIFNREYFGAIVVSDAHVFVNNTIVIYTSHTYICIYGVYSNGAYIIFGQCVLVSG